MSRHNAILNNIKESLLAVSTTKTKLGINKTKSEDMENETPEVELMDYKQDFLNMNIGSLRAIMNHAASILKSVEENNEMVKNNLTESWLQGKIAITEDYMRTIHDFVKYVSEADDKSVAGCGCGGNKKKAETKTATTTTTQKETTQTDTSKDNNK